MPQIHAELRYINILTFQRHEKDLTETYTIQTSASELHLL